MTTRSIIDSSFYSFDQRSASLGSERLGESPQYIKWSIDIHECDTPIFFTDIRLRDVLKFKDIDAPKIAWLLEPPWKPGHYDVTRQLESHFDYILTYWRDFMRSDKYLWYPIGGSWIAPVNHLPRDCNKTQLVSMMISEKIAAPGHRMRRNIYNQYPDIDYYGRAIKPITSKRTALDPYMYQIVVESQSLSSYFTEKIIDCFTQRVIPIYHGDPTICDRFDCDGILRFDTLGELDAILLSINERDYADRFTAIENNARLAPEYFCAEDWLVSHYPFLFKE